jgi:hypothetical protein
LSFTSATLAPAIKNYIARRSVEGKTGREATQVRSAASTATIAR